MSKCQAPSPIRNFCIIAHIDHGKSTLADRILQITSAVDSRKFRDQFLDMMDLEREKGITIKSQAVVINYKKDNINYMFHLIDTPGHVDFSYEVSRALAACEGALLLIDAVQGIEAQTLANFYLALDAGLKIIPVINKIDLPSARIDSCISQLKELGFEKEEIILVSAKTGKNVEKVLAEIIEKIPAPAMKKDMPLKALIFDSNYDSYLGVICYIRLFDGRLKKGDKILFMQSGKEYIVETIGKFTPFRKEVDELVSGEVGYITAAIKSLADVRVGDTITGYKERTKEKLPGYKEAKPMVYCSFFPASGDNFADLQKAIEKLSLNDAAISYETISSDALGFGIKCGFLGLLHMEIIQERLEREFDLELIRTAPNVLYKIVDLKNKEIDLTSASKMPSKHEYLAIKEPFINAKILTKEEFIGNIMKISADKRGEFITMEYLDPQTCILEYNFPLSEIIFDFYDKLKSVSKGYASLDYEFLEFRESKLVKLEILINSKPVDALSTIIHKAKAYETGKKIINKLRKTIPRQLFEVVIQATLGSKIIARESVKALRKDVIAKCYGGDITRKRKLLEKQKKGKKKMKQIGSVQLPQEAFLSVLSVE